MAGVRYRLVNGTRRLIDEWRLAQARALDVLAARHGRPIRKSELAAELGVPVDDITNTALVKNGLALYRKLPGTKEKGLWPRPQRETRLLEAITAFRGLEEGEDQEWREPRRNRRRGFVRRTLRVTRTLKNRVRSLLLRSKDYLGLHSLRDVEDHHLGMILDAVRELKLEDSGLPRSSWNSSDPVARRARRTATKRVSEVRAFLSWSEWQGYLSLHTLSADSLPEAWIKWILRVEGDPPLVTAARRLAKDAMAIGADSPERLVEIGFDRLIDSMLDSPKYKSRSSAQTVVSKLKHAWTACANAEGHPPLPAWEPKEMEQVPTFHGWWNAYGFLKGADTSLDEPGMELQLAEARNLRDWWTKSQPGLHNASDGCKLPPRPERNFSGRKPLGARTEDMNTAYNPLRTVSLLQKFALDVDDPEHRIPEAVLRQMPWRDLFDDRARLQRFASWMLRRNYEENGGRRNSEGRWEGGYLSEGVMKVWYVYTLLWAYFAGWTESRQSDVDKEIAGCDPNDRERFEKLKRRERQIEIELKEWTRAASDMREHIRAEILRFGGETKPRKPKHQIRSRLDHSKIERIVDALRSRRLALAAEIRSRTAALKKRVSGLRRHPCSSCGRTACDEHHPMPELTASGLARAELTRTYCSLIVREALIRLLSVVPWRPGQFRKARIGEHFFPEDLRIQARGLDLKKATEGNGRIKKMEGCLGDYECWESANEIDLLIEVIQLMLDEARPWLLDNPTKRASPHPEADAYLFLSGDGRPWATTAGMAASFGSALVEGTRLANEACPDDPIQLPEGYGAQGTYILRFLWGHRAVSRGATFEEVAWVLGNHPDTVRKSYHDLKPQEAQNRMARAYGSVHAGDPDSEALPGSPPSDDVERYGDKLARLLEAHAAGLIDEEEFRLAKGSLRKESE